MYVYVFVSVCTLTFVALLTLANRLDYCDIRAEMHFNNKSNLYPRGEQPLKKTIEEMQQDLKIKLIICYSYNSRVSYLL